jgi:hypothetical protein
MSKPLVWTVRIENRATPHLWLLHEGPESARAIERHVATCVALGYTIIVGLSSTPTRERARRSPR